MSDDLVLHDDGGGSRGGITSIAISSSSAYIFVFVSLLLPSARTMHLHSGCSGYHLSECSSLPCASASPDPEVFAGLGKKDDQDEYLMREAPDESKERSQHLCLAGIMKSNM